MPRFRLFFPSFLDRRYNIIGKWVGKFLDILVLATLVVRIQQNGYVTIDIKPIATFINLKFIIVQQINKLIKHWAMVIIQYLKFDS